MTFAYFGRRAKRRLSLLANHNSSDLISGLAQESVAKGQKASRKVEKAFNNTKGQIILVHAFRI